MGALDRRFEARIERQLEVRKQKGVPAGASPARANGATPGASPWAPGDRRAEIPPLGLREYWYPALPLRKVGRKPRFWTLLGDELVFFRDKAGAVVALSDVCPHRGASLSEGDCFYRGTVSCPYHGATFDRSGECVAFLTEGPDSTMVGKLRARTYPTQTLRDWVFIWMGDGEPAPIEQDLAPEMFEEGAEIHSTYTYWYTNWIVALENHGEAHNQFYVHRDSIKQLSGLSTGRTRTPLGPRVQFVNGRSVVSHHTGSKYYAKDGKVPHQMYYPGVDGVWPLHRYRQLWTWFFQRFDSGMKYGTVPEEWRLGHHLPCIARTGGMNTRYAIAVRPNLSRIVYFAVTRPRTNAERVRDRLRYRLLENPLEYNFSSQDNGVASPCRYWTAEYLSPTDAQVVALRKLVLEHSRDALRRAPRPNGQDGAPPAPPDAQPDNGHKRAPAPPEVVTT
jgi:phenylpropionate dioxygenase-like ring-hydroxylating dioxygenase large terminal subunit